VFFQDLFQSIHDTQLKANGSMRMASVDVVSCETRGGGGGKALEVVSLDKVGPSHSGTRELVMRCINL
jgi:hypothetical protein